ncbi:MAG: hypothetical protein CO001_00935 [Candidatus Portnoybacteria bacterium CG_4_8_14_3_um_filter_40_10]|uniref:Uncharacterized protein n=4 Tax=Candidatus Portnoyibacteriota TaxID=1817913 RepID=A0A2M7IJ61_9BACT|nr:MAG: hypothetical protein COV84_00560 [Candidatus Portnoybacteria bacterium CG11_big_fil_rev_8_21_14_0_20_40_15]PIS29963.1 MAG: hypothetical protein COT41_03900 [Candidatus Portnoybacteria bacterium CG08_land_8_20_14_0_20_40_83]PIW76521.1 MAG: hypothetical protein CO001_00935 [Candidatus Portnoybacteria bacterium CG_4_8_14_3_um_filter_40_10]PIY74273.1 MAG: hypothetical protein COY85_03730 [Candidatus Portnoybacteria bacterium CG_4_10_14_0_8_um_filter_40_50]PJA64718.1 MAG: hypothetical protei
MEKEPQFLKNQEILEEKSEENSEAKPEEILVLDAEVENAKLKLAEEQKERQEKEDFFEKTQVQEQIMTKGFLSKFTEVPKNVKRGIMILAAAGIFLSVSGKAMAAGEHRVYQGWQNTTRQVERMPYQYEAREKQKMEAIQYQYQLKERVRSDAYQEYLKESETIQRIYEQRKFDIMIGRIEGATDYFGKQKANQALEQWKQDETLKAKQRWATKAWAAEEQYRQEVQKIQQWR